LALLLLVPEIQNVSHGSAFSSVRLEEAEEEEEQEEI